MCSGRASRMRSSPPATATAATYVAAWMRSGTVRWSAGRSEPGSTPRTTSVDVPMPGDVGAHRHEHLAEVDDLRLAGGVVDRRHAVGAARPR